MRLQEICHSKQVLITTKKEYLNLLFKIFVSKSNSITHKIITIVFYILSVDNYIVWMSIKYKLGNIFNVKFQLSSIRKKIKVLIIVEEVANSYLKNKKYLKSLIFLTWYAFFFKIVVISILNKFQFQGVLMNSLNINPLTSTIRHMKVNLSHV